MRGCRTDHNHGDAVEGLRRAGYRVHDTSTLGGGFPDLVVGTPWGSLALVEIKNELQRWRVTPQQADFRRNWRRYPVFVALGAEDAIRQMTSARDKGEL